MSSTINNNYLKFPHRASNDGPVTKSLKFLLTDRGRGIVYYTVGAAIVGVSVAFLLKETYFLEKVLNHFQVYKYVCVLFHFRSPLVHKS